MSRGSFDICDVRENLRGKAFNEPARALASIAVVQVMQLISPNISVSAQMRRMPILDRHRPEAMQKCAFWESLTSRTPENRTVHAIIQIQLTRKVQIVVLNTT